MNILISACLLGVSCRYDGKSKPHEKLMSMMKSNTFIPVCPEILGGLATPRSPAEIVGNRVVNSDGLDVTKQYIRGAEEVLRICKLYDCKLAILKSNSPSCGVGRVYDGTFKGILTDGHGICAKMLMDNGITVLTENDI